MKNLIFDFDGVLGDTWEAVLHGLVESGREPTREGAIVNATNYFLSKPPYAGNHSMTDKDLKDEYDWTVKFGHAVHEHGFSLFEEFVKQIENISDAKIAVVSSGSQNYVLPALARTNINPTHILAFEDHHSKEEKIELICKDWGVDVSEVYYFTDTLADVYELGEFIKNDKLIGVTWGYCSKEQLLTELSEEQILDKPSDLRTLFN